MTVPMDDRTAIAVSSATASLMLARGRRTFFQPDESAELFTVGPRGSDDCGDEEEEEVGWSSRSSSVSSLSAILGATLSSLSFFAERIAVTSLCLRNVHGARPGRATTTGVVRTISACRWTGLFCVKDEPPWARCRVSTAGIAQRV